MSKRSQIKKTYTARGLTRYEVKVWHEELNKYQLIRGDDQYVVEQKACAKMAQWDEMWAQKKAAEQKRQEIEEKKKLADERTAESREALATLEHILEHTLHVDNTVDWESLKNHSDCPEVKPKKPKLPRKPDPSKIPREPQCSDSEYAVKLGFLDKLIRSRRVKKEKEAEACFKKAHKQWQDRKKQALALDERRMQKYGSKVEKQEAEYEAVIKAWRKKCAKYREKRNKSNAVMDEKKAKYLNGNPEAILDYYDMVLSNSEYPDYFPQSYQLDYNPENKLLVVDYQVVPINSIPTLKELKYVQLQEGVVEKHISQSQLNKLYDSLLYQIALRTVHELYRADQANALLSIVFNGYVHSIDSATGQETNVCVFSLQASKDEFLQINLANVDPKACFRKLKGIGSSKLHSLTPVAPILKIERADKRFVPSYVVAEGIDNGDNLAVMEWQDFEHLVRELFEKEFAGSGGEVKVTRASRDGGVDAVVFDPDTLRGGKIVIQAKRYTNTVGVSAVRDLYGTVINEGANKGILITTADYGADAYEFAKGKPLVLLNGSNLLHLLQKHGHKAKIDLQEAKEILAEEQKA